jgi:hypothetical protein
MTEEQKEYYETETAQRCDKVSKRMFNTPPKPHDFGDVGASLAFAEGVDMLATPPVVEGKVP